MITKFQNHILSAIAVLSITNCGVTTATYSNRALVPKSPESKDGSAATAATPSPTPTPGSPVVIAATSVLPATGSSAGGTLITITGKGFASGASIVVGGTVCLNIKWASETSLSCETGAHAPGTVDLTVSNSPTSSATVSGGFTYQDEALTYAQYLIQLGSAKTTAANTPAQFNICGDTQRTIGCSNAWRSIAQDPKTTGFKNLFFGDSITDNWDTSSFADCSVAGVGTTPWNRYFAKDSLNFGLACDSTANTLYEIAQGELPFKVPMSVIVIAIGTNNLGNMNWSVEDTAAAIALIAGQALLKMPEAHILISAILPRGDDATLLPKITAVNRIVATYADNKRVFFKNYGNLFSSDGTLGGPTDLSLFNVDKLHPNTAGYKKWAPVLRADIEAITPN